MRDAFVCRIKHFPQLLPVVTGAGIMMTGKRDRAVFELCNDGGFIRMLGVERADIEHPFATAFPRRRAGNIRTMPRDPFVQIEFGAGIIIDRRDITNRRRSGDRTASGSQLFFRNDLEISRNFDDPSQTMRTLRCGIPLAVRRTGEPPDAGGIVDGKVNIDGIAGHHGNVFQNFMDQTAISSREINAIHELCAVAGIRNNRFRPVHRGEPVADFESLFVRGFVFCIR